MDEHYFSRLAGTADTGRYLARPSTAGPWSPRLQHGGPPNALAVTAAERAVRAATGRDDLTALRLSADFVGPVPVAEVEVRARVVRAARSAVLAEVTLASAGRDCLLTRVWFVRSADTTDIAAQPAGPPATPPPRPGSPDALGIAFGYGASLEWRFLHGALTDIGPAAVWVLPRTRLTDGDDAPLSGLARAALVADSGSGVSAELDWAGWSFVNVDLDVHLARPFVGDWVLMEAATQLGPAGSALARSTLSDEVGVVGAGSQTLVLARAAR